MKRWFVGSASLLTAAALVAAGCGSSNKSSSKQTTSSESKGGTLTTVANAAPSGSPDPQVNYTLQEWQLLVLSHDGLVGFKRASGTEGTKKVPDLAQSIPKPTDDGKTWTFKLRPGIKFSNGQALTGADVKATFERLFKIGNSPNAGTWYNVIQGADACIKTPKSCDLSQGIKVDGNTVTFNLTTGDPELLDKLAVPFAFILPASTPATNVNIPPPGTGPYKWAQYSPNKQLKLVRNTFFKEWSKDAQPAGNPDVIVQKFGLSPEAQVTAGREQPGRLDVRPAAGRPARRAELEVRRPGARQPADGRLVLRLQHPHPAVQQPEGAPGGQLRDRPQRAREGLRRAEAGRSDLPDPAAQLPGLQALLPVHQEPGQRQVDGARHGEGQAARRPRRGRRARRSRSTRPPPPSTRASACTSSAC